MSERKVLKLPLENCLLFVAWIFFLVTAFPLWFGSLLHSMGVGSLDCIFASLVTVSGTGRIFFLGLGILGLVTAALGKRIGLPLVLSGSVFIWLHTLGNIYCSISPDQFSSG